MKVLRHHRIEAALVLDGEWVTHLVIEEPVFLRQFLRGIEEQLESGEEFLRYYDGKDEKDFSKVGYFLYDPFHCPLDEKKTGTFLQKDVPLRLKDEKKEDFQRIVHEIQSFLHGLILDYPIPLRIDEETSLPALLKAFSLSPAIDEESFLEGLVMKVAVLRHVSKKDVFLFYNLRDTLSEEEFLLFHQEMRRLEIPYLLLSSHLPSKKSSIEKIVRIDSDLYEQHIEPKSER